MEKSSTPPLNPARASAILPRDKTRVLMMGLRQALIMALGLFEDYLDMPHSVMSADERHEFNRWRAHKAARMGG